MRGKWQLYLNDDRVRREVHPPCKGGGTHQDLDQTFSEQIFNQTAITSQHPRMVDAKPVGEKFPEFFIPGLSNLQHLITSRLLEGVRHFAGNPSLKSYLSPTCFSAVP
jgi:hypothetical protein